ncbi:MAG: hypothetical protein RMJ15_07385 [Nitrososphaerota archaeon]|nr:hypothetical protein [Candidatus Bathyarchaeota archaeon]MDW8023539.1 hypothetical protein [Nitrososphaerota archaeon]
MVKRATFVRLSLLIVEFTSIPLLVLASIYLISGYQMLAPQVRIIPEPRKIHVDSLLRVLTIFLAYLHILGGIIVVVERRLRKEVLKKIIETVAVIVITSLLTFFLIIEASL